MFNSFNSHVVTRAHVSIVNPLIAGEITISEASERLNDFNVNEHRIENRIHDLAVFASYSEEY